MSRNETKWAREQDTTKSVPVKSDSAAPIFFNERHYTVAELAKLWNLSPDTVRRLFENEPGILALGEGGHRYGRRRYTTLRIPESVAERVHRRLSKV